MKRGGRNTNSFCRHLRPYWYTSCSLDLTTKQPELGFHKCFPSPSDRQYQATEVPENSDDNDFSHDALSSSKRTCDTAKYPSTTNFITPNFAKHESGNSQTQLQRNQSMSQIPPTCTILIRDDQKKETFEDEEEFFQKSPFQKEKASGDELRITTENPPRVDHELTGGSPRKVFDLNQTKTSVNPCKDTHRHNTSLLTSKSDLDFICHRDGLKTVDNGGKFHNKFIFDGCVKEKDRNISAGTKDCVHESFVDTSLKLRIHEEERKLLTQTKCGVTVTLLNSSLWRAFNEIGTEMIINRGGRRMFPFLALSVKGLEPECYYNVNVQIIPAATRRFKYINMKWIPVGLADTEAIQIPYTHSDSPNTGTFWNNCKITFSKIKLTNNLDCASQNILLHSMHKYRIVTTFTLLDDCRLKEPGAKASLSFSFAETDFMAVTAYQNEAVTQMKIHNNPFAKAFRDANFSSMRRNIASRKRKLPIQNPEPVNAQRDSQPTVCNRLGSFSGPHLQPYPSNDYSFGSTGIPLTQTPSLLGIGNLSYCLPWGSFPIIPSPLCSRLFPFAASQYGSSFPMGEGFLTNKCDAASMIPLQVKTLESPSTSAMEKM